MKKIILPVIALFLLITPVKAEDDFRLATLKYNSFLENAPNPEDVTAFENFVNNGMRFIYLGEAGSLDVWLSIKNGGLQILSTTVDGKSMIFGSVYNSKGQNVVLELVKERFPNVGEALYMVSQKAVVESMGNSINSWQKANIQEYAKQTAIENGDAPDVNKAIWDSLNSSFYVEKGNPMAPVMYAFVDIYCGHCNQLHQKLEEYINKSIVRVRYIPIGILSEESVKSTLGIMSAPNYSAAWNDYYDHGNTAVTATPVTDQAIAMLRTNTEIFEKWNLRGTPSLFYKKLNGGEVKFLYGQPEDLEDFINDITR